MAKLSAHDALDLAKQFKQSAVTLGQYQLDHWDELSKAQRRELTDQEYTLLDHSQNLVTLAVGLILDDAQPSLDQIKQATTEANAAIGKIKDIKKILTIATSLVTLGAALYGGNPTGIANAIGSLASAVEA